MPSERYEFKGYSGEMLAARLERPDGDIKAYAVFAHCFTGTKDFVASRTITRALASRGIATLRFDFTGLGNSEGDFSNTNFSSNIEDIIQATNALEATHEAPKLLIGHSLGGAATLAAAPQIASVTAVATLAAPFDPSHVAHLFEDNLEFIMETGKANVDLFGRTFTITSDFIADIHQHNQRERISTMRKALLVMHAPTDDTVGIENAKMIYDAAHHPKSFVCLDDMDHLLTKPEHADYVADILATWGERYIHRKPRPPARFAKQDKAHGRVALQPTGNGPFSFLTHAGPHTLLADQPLSNGGKGTGPTPYDLLLSALGACTAMTLKMYARRKMIRLDDVKVVLKQNRLHAKDCDDCEQNGAKHIREITRDITIKGDVTLAEKKRLLDIANLCPVQKTIEGQTKFRTNLQEE